jgi:hypothetical protein
LQRPQFAARGIAEKRATMRVAAGPVGALAAAGAPSPAAPSDPHGGMAFSAAPRGADSRECAARPAWSAN